MNDADFEAQKARIQKLLDLWLTPLGLRWWSITVIYDRDLEPSSQTVETDSNSCVYMHVTTHWEYIFATVTVYVHAIQDVDDDELERMFLHEMAHIMLSAMRYDGAHMEERTASELARAFQWIKDAFSPPAGSITTALHPPVDGADSAPVE